MGREEVRPVHSQARSKENLSAGTDVMGLQSQVLAMQDSFLCSDFFDLYL